MTGNKAMNERELTAEALKMFAQAVESAMKAARMTQEQRRAFIETIKRELHGVIFELGDEEPERTQ